MSEHIVRPQTYLSVFAALVLFTLVTVWVANHDFGAFNTPIALLIAAIKATLVVLFFMHVRWSPKLVWLAACAGLIWLVILIGMTMTDFLTRGWLPQSKGW
jgi:cytochrome c oxidase subunit IV